MRQVARDKDNARIPRDPAPSRWRYRYQRLMLTPGFRKLLRIGAPLALIAGIAGAWFGQEANRMAVQATWIELRDEFQSRPEFMVSAMDIIGADGDLSGQIRDVLPLNFPVTSFDLELEDMRELVAALNAVESARLRVRPGGILEVAVVQREPVAVWRTAQGLKLIDAGGHFVSPLQARADRPDLPLIAGMGADAALDEALRLYAVAEPLTEKLRGLVRLGDRRWDVVLEGGQKILLPSDNPVRALERVMALDSAQDMLDRDIALVDMRNAARPTIRLNPPAAAAFRRTSGKLQ
ncbi:cell division protein FtsQ/DivIB [Roseisalinus antarcticus]|uniref:Cell division protein FtsQ n=1 Tax=Roseisalinus antarcticus TaxID=254357 RepID=A0A1Y5SFY8_9RHOB|nr:cell division protein FtsQ/DivIB [Roseisalinus antarcticus]SLN39919.1 Cell division protein FtsQ [Roseisalinus antarcticus]